MISKYFCSSHLNNHIRWGPKVQSSPYAVYGRKLEVLLFVALLGHKSFWRYKRCNPRNYNISHFKLRRTTVELSCSFVLCAGFNWCISWGIRIYSFSFENFVGCMPDCWGILRVVKCLRYAFVTLVMLRKSRIWWFEFSWKLVAFLANRILKKGEAKYTYHRLVTTIQILDTTVSIIYNRWFEKISSVIHLNDNAQPEHVEHPMNGFEIVSFVFTLCLWHLST